METEIGNTVEQLLSQMSTEALDEMLHTELNKKPLDPEAIRVILRVLRNREKDFPVEITPQIQSAWERYQRNMEALDYEEAQTARKRRGFLRILSAAAVFALVLLCMLPQRVEADSLWNRLVRWTDQIVEFFSPNDNSHRIVEYEFKTDHPGLQEVYDKIVELGVTGPCVPMWLPDGFTLVECKIEDNHSGEQLYAHFSDGEKGLTYIANVVTQLAHQEFQRDEELFRQREINNTTYSIFSNLENFTCIWTVENIDFTISTDCQEEELDRIVNSIYTTED